MALQQSVDLKITLLVSQNIDAEYFRERSHVIVLCFSKESSWFGIVVSELDLGKSRLLISEPLSCHLRHSGTASYCYDI